MTWLRFFFVQTKEGGGVNLTSCALVYHKWTFAQITTGQHYLIKITEINCYLSGHHFSAQTNTYPITTNKIEKNCNRCAKNKNSIKTCSRCFFLYLRILTQQGSSVLSPLKNFQASTQSVLSAAAALEENLLYQKNLT